MVHDELDLPWLDVRRKVGGGHAGHNGVRSAQSSAAWGTPDFARVRVGIGKPPEGFRGKGADWVLTPFGAAEREEIPRVIERAAGLVVPERPRTQGSRGSP